MYMYVLGGVEEEWECVGEWVGVTAWVRKGVCGWDCCKVCVKRIGCVCVFVCL